MGRMAAQAARANIRRLPSRPRPGCGGHRAGGSAENWRLLFAHMAFGRGMRAGGHVLGYADIRWLLSLHIGVRSKHRIFCGVHRLLFC